MDNKLTETGSSNRRVAAVPIWVKPYLTIEEAAEYTGIGRDKLYEMTSLADCPFVLWVGNRRMIKRRIFDEYIEQIHAYTAIVKENIEYDTLIQSARLGEKEYIDEIVELLVETISAKRDTLSIGGAEYPYQFVKNKLLKVESSHIQYLLECLHDNTTKIHNVRAYLLACIFNAPSTINNYYRAEVNHDMYGGGNL